MSAISVINLAKDLDIDFNKLYRYIIKQKIPYFYDDNSEAMMVSILVAHTILPPKKKPKEKKKIIDYQMLEDFERRAVYTDRIATLASMGGDYKDEKVRNLMFESKNFSKEDILDLLALADYYFNRPDIPYQPVVPSQAELDDPNDLYFDPMDEVYYQDLDWS